MNVTIGNNSVQSNNDGSYKLTNIKTGSNQITATKAGYKSHFGTVNVSENSNTPHDIALTIENIVGTFDFEDGLIDPFTGGWLIDNTNAHTSGFSLRPPDLTGGSTSSTEITYNTVHTEMSFWIAGTPASLYIDDRLYDTYSTASIYTWIQFKVIVPDGSHTYRWEVTPSQTGRPNTYLDDVVFSRTEPVANTGNTFGFEKGFLTLEFTTWANNVDGWTIDNSIAHTGEFSLRPAQVVGGNASSTEMAYNTPHTEMSFWIAGTPVSLYIDNQLEKIYSTATIYTWIQYKVAVTSGVHTYRWEVTPTQSGRPLTFLDDIGFQ